jgi:Formate hydrogenlyase subunit 6/NADH:ubiquinone oxidoreductase 23 kD subunit (chain I)
MNAIKEAFKTVSDLWSLMVGLKVTGKYFLEPQRTVRYPWKAVSNLDTYKGHLELVGGMKDPFKPRCISCGMCALACPSHCLTVVKKKAPKPTPEEEKALAEAKASGEKTKDKTPKDPEQFLYDYTLCSLCGTCMENCPAGALRFSKERLHGGLFAQRLPVRPGAEASGVGRARHQSRACGPRRRDERGLSYGTNGQDSLRHLLRSSS